MREIKQIILSEEDLKEIIAERFNTDTLDVNIEVSTGDPQYPSYSVYAIVNQDIVEKPKNILKDNWILRAYLKECGDGELY